MTDEKPRQIQQKLTSGPTNEKVLIKSVSYSQDEILSWIMRLYCPNGFELDPTYGRGNFYGKYVPRPKYRYDLNPQTSDTIQADCRKLPHADNSISSIVFDPPFVAGAGTTGIIKNRFGYYKTVQGELWPMYHQALDEFYRCLKNNGVLVVKCQDTINTSNQYLSHVEIINYAIGLGFYPIDIFVLVSKNRLPQWNLIEQQHARKFHCYYIVFVKQKCPVKYWGFS